MSVYAIDPYAEAGRPGERAAAAVAVDAGRPVGAADQLTMGYGFRWKFTFKGDGLPIEPPDDYDPRQFELYRRAFRQGVDILSGRVMRGKVDGWEPSGGRVFSGGAGNLARALVRAHELWEQRRLPGRGLRHARPVSGNRSRISCAG
jgi:hypothetical protein